MKKPTAEKVIIVHRPQKPSAQETAPAGNWTAESGIEMTPELSEELTSQEKPNNP